MPLSEAALSTWAQGPASTEQEHADSSVAAVLAALRARYGTRVRIFAQGSYRNRTNVRRESDVDLVALDTGSQFAAFPGVSPQAASVLRSRLPASDWTFQQFKSDVEGLLRTHFGTQRVRRQDKCINLTRVVGNISADIVPAFVHVRYDSAGAIRAQGIEFQSDQGDHHNSFPDEHYASGVEKHTTTQRQYKKMVRILKCIRNSLATPQDTGPGGTPSFFIESLVYNADNALFVGDTYRQELKTVLQGLWTALGEAGVEERFVEVSRLKWLFRGPKTVDAAKAFITAAWTAVGY